MSEKEKKKRAGYRRRRKILIGSLTALLALLTLFVGICGVLLHQSNKTSYINYTEVGKVDYKVGLLENDFYDQSELGAGQAYVASLIDRITATFDYALNMEAEGVTYRYAYFVDAQLQIVDDSTKKPIYNPTYPITTPQKLTQQGGGKLALQEKVVIDYASFNERAKSFVESLQLNGTSSLLTVRMHIEVLSACDEFENNTKNEYVVALTVPLTTQTVDIQMTTSVPQSERKVLACESAAGTSLYRGVLLYGGSADILLFVALVLVVFLTRNKDINYTLKVKRLVAAYKSFVQRLKNEFDTTGYQVLQVSSFNEMLDIRDTIQSPILMHENEDMTATKFYIPTNSSLVYLFEIRVEDYDEIYGITPAAESSDLSRSLPEESDKALAPISEPVNEPVTEPAPETPLAETQDATPELAVAAMAEPELVPESTPVAPDDVESGFDFGPRYDYSFEANLILSGDEVKGFYRQITDFARAYGVKVARSWSRERIYLGRNLFAVVTFRFKKLVVAFAMDPKTADPKYHAIDVSGSKKYDKTPMLMRISSARKAKFATQLLEVLFRKAELQDRKRTVEPTVIPTSSKKELLEQGLIRLEKE